VAIPSQLRAYSRTLLEVSSGQGNQHNQTVLGRSVNIDEYRND